MAADTRGGWFAVPSPIRRLFNHFPLLTYPPEPLPGRAPTPSSTRRPRLYVFALHDDDRPSFNPSCLKWQAFLRIAGVDVDVVPSNNHASPSGALPFLIPAASSSSSTPSTPLTGAKIHKYAQDHASLNIPSVTSPRLEAYQALLTQTVRPAWLHALYLNDTNAPLLATLYLPPSPLLSSPLSHTVRAAATTEILNTTRRALISPPQLRADLLAALAALSTLLADHDWFFGAAAPGLFDGEEFAYTHLMLDDEMGWRDAWLAESVAQFDNLVRHRERLYKRCWGGESGTGKLLAS